MKKVIFAIFAHPDDEAFGPGGTLLAEAKHGADVYLISLTLGGAGTNPDNVADLTKVRASEWQTAGELLGATELISLNYQDGHLDNLALIEIADKLEIVVGKRLARYDETVSVEFMSMDLGGITGHIDHIVAARAACLSFYRHKRTDPRFTRIRLVCLPYSAQPNIDTQWLFMEPGRKENEIDEVIDNRRYRKEIIAIMRAHHSQRHDSEAAIASRGENLGIDHFIVKN